MFPSFFLESTEKSFSRRVGRTSVALLIVLELAMQRRLKYDSSVSAECNEIESHAAKDGTHYGLRVQSTDPLDVEIDRVAEGNHGATVDLNLSAVVPGVEFQQAAATTEHERAGTGEVLEDEALLGAPAQS